MRRATKSSDRGGTARPRPPALVLALTVLALAPAPLGCGDDEGSSGDAGTDTGGGDAVTTTNLDPTDGEPAIPDLPQNDDPARVECTGEPGGVFDATAIVGESVAEAMRAARQQGCSIRVAVRNGEQLALTQDFRPDRVNVAVRDGEVIEIVDIG